MPFFYVVLSMLFGEENVMLTQDTFISWYSKTVDVLQDIFLLQKYAHFLV